MQKLNIRLFGPPRIFQSGASQELREIRFGRRKTLALLAYLAAHGPASRETLATLLWPDASQEQASTYLRQALWDFRKAAGEAGIRSEGAVLRLDESVGIDIHEFTHWLAAWKSGDHSGSEAIALLEAATRLYTGDFLAGFSLRDSPEFDAWQSLQAEGLRLQLAEALEALASLHGAQGNYPEAIACTQRWLSLDELNEPAHRLLMRLFEASGQRSVALRQYETCRTLLEKELEIAPEPATTQLFQDIGAWKPPLVEAHAAQRASMRAPLPVFLPAQATPFLGREPELAHIKQILASPDCRLITLVGPGGSGKTRLAIQAAGQGLGFPHQQSFPHGIYFASLAAACCVEEAVQELAGALKLFFQRDERQCLTAEAALAQLKQYLAEKKLLIVLDNLEQLAGAPLIGLISGLLADAPGLKLIATSRIRLNIPEEWVIEVDGLPYPEGEAGEAGCGLAAVRLFLQGAERAAHFQPTSQDWPAITRICQLVAGMPLGIELAAAWTRLFSPQEIADEMERSLDFLESNRPGEAERHRSLRVVFEQSWRLLNPGEQDVFRRLGVFRGGFTRAAAFQVAGATLNRLAGLVDHSLLRRVSSGRFELHELVRQYAEEKLLNVPEEQAGAQARHAQYYIGWLQEQGERLRGREQRDALALLRSEVQNVRQAWRWLCEQRDTARLAPALPDLILFYEMSGDHRAGSEALRGLAGAYGMEPALAGRRPFPAPGELDKHTAGLLGLTLAGVRHFERDIRRAEANRPLLTHSLALVRPLPPSPMKAFTLLLGGIGPGLPGPEAVAVSQESAQIFEASGDLWGSGLAYLIVGDTASFGVKDAALSRSAYHTGLDIFTRLDNQWGRALCLFGLAMLDHQAGQIEAAYQQTVESLSIYQQMENRGRILQTRELLGHLANTLGRPEEARCCFQANEDYLEEVGDHFHSRYYTTLISHLQLDQMT